MFNICCSISLIRNGGRLSTDFPQESSFGLKVETYYFWNRVLLNITAVGLETYYQHLSFLSVFVSAKNLLSRLSGVKFETLFALVTNNSHSNSIGRLIPTNNKLIMLLLLVLTLLLAIFILLYHVKLCFHVNDLLRNRTWEKSIC